MLACQQNVPRIIFMQTSADIAHKLTHKVNKPTFSGSKILTISIVN